ncbi:MAG: hypothetical protein FD123_1695 [Bacteroidetes bacterium]|nr:MAG: hypothetical protein FD123_1695 [Bacteroidota bacterium]
MANEKIKEWLQKVNEGIKDAVTLDVTTLTGDDLKGVITFDETTLRFSITKDSIQKATLLAHTHIEIDQDTLLFIKSPLSESEKGILDVHNAAAKAAIEARHAFVKMIAEIVT